MNIDGTGRNASDNNTFFAIHLDDVLIVGGSTAQIGDAAATVVEASPAGGVRVTPSFLAVEAVLQVARHWGVAARVKCGVCVNTLGFGHGAGGLEGLARPLASAPCTRVGRRGSVPKRVPARPRWPLSGSVSRLDHGGRPRRDRRQDPNSGVDARRALSAPLPIIFGILFATLANHAAAGLAGTYFGDLLNGPWLRWILGISFLSVAVWALFPDKYVGNVKAIGRSGAFISALVAFFLAEIGDKTQIATVGLAARFEQFYPVVRGTTLGMMLANIPAVLIGGQIADKLPVKAIRITAAVVFAAMGVLTLAGVGK
jgi:putative Ca2+/H+ antiporter (TMEM165/GDT1 family)